MVTAGRVARRECVLTGGPAASEISFSHHGKTRDGLVSGQPIIKVTTIQVKPKWVEGHGTPESDDKAVKTRGPRAEMDTSAETVMLPR